MRILKIYLEETKRKNLCLKERRERDGEKCCLFRINCYTHVGKETQTKEIHEHV